MSSQETPSRPRRHTSATLWIVVLVTALGVFLAGMAGTGLALADDIHEPTSITVVAHGGTPSQVP